MDTACVAVQSVITPDRPMSKQGYGHTDFSVGFPAASDTLFNHLENIGRVVMPPALSANARRHVLNLHIAVFDLAVESHASY
jgi:hypothetical protein